MVQGERKMWIGEWQWGVVIVWTYPLRFRNKHYQTTSDATFGVALHLVGAQNALLEKSKWVFYYLHYSSSGVFSDICKKVITSWVLETYWIWITECLINKNIYFTCCPISRSPLLRSLSSMGQPKLVRTLQFILDFPISILSLFLWTRDSSILYTGSYRLTPTQLFTFITDGEINW